MSEIWDAFDHMDVIENTPNGPLPEANRGSWFCPVADRRDSYALDEILQYEGIGKIYDLGAGDCRFAVDMDRRGYDVVAYETLADIAEYGLGHFPGHSVKLVVDDYYDQWPEIKDDEAAFVALGRLNVLPGGPTNGIAFDDIAIPDFWTYKNYIADD